MPQPLGTAHCARRALFRERIRSAPHCGNAELIWQASDGTGLIKLPAGTDARSVLGVEVVKA
jgi:hypothetical protein